MKSGTTRKLYGSLNSPPTLKVMACLFEHDLDFEFVPIDLQGGEHKKKTFLSMNPFGQVPVYEEGGVVQFESRAIIRSMGHQDAKKGEELISWDSRQQAVIANWIDVEDHHFEPPALKLISELVLKPKKGLTPDEETVSAAEAKLGKVLDVYEARLSEFKYLAYEKYSIADMIHLPNIQALIGTHLGKKLFDARPHLSAWCADILARPAWVKVVKMQQKAQA